MHTNQELGTVKQQMRLYKCPVWKLTNSTPMEKESSTELHIRPLDGAAFILHLKKLEKLIDMIICVAEWIKSIIPMCEIHSFNQSIVQLLSMLSGEFYN